MNMNKKQLLAGAMSALLVATSMPAPALAAEVAGLGLQQPETQEQAPTAPAPTGATKEVTATSKVEADEDNQSTSAAQPNATVATQPAAPVASQNLVAPAAPVSALAGNAQAVTSALAKDAKAATAPTFNLDFAANVDGMVSYTVQNADGTTEYSDSAIIGKDNVASVSDPAQNADGTWTVTVTLKSGLTAANFNVPSWALDASPSEYAVDASASKMTIEFSTESAAGTSYYAYGSARANLVFKRQAAQPTAPAFDFAKDAQWDAQNVRYTVEGGNFDGADYSNATTIGNGPATAGKPYQDADGTWKVDVALDATGADFWFPDFLADSGDYELDKDASQLMATYTWTGAKWECIGNARANLVFTKKAPQPAVPTYTLAASDVTMTTSQVKALADKFALAKAMLTVTNQDGDDAFDDVSEYLTVDVAPGDGNEGGFADFDEFLSQVKPGTYTVGFVYAGQVAQATLTVKADESKPADPSKPNQGQGSVTGSVQKPGQKPARKSVATKASAKSSKRVGGNALPQTGDASGAAIAAAAATGTMAVLGGSEVLRRQRREE